MNFDRFVGIPFVAGGRGFDGCDCYGLLHLIFRELRGITLASFDTRYTWPEDRRAIAALIAGELEPWQPVAEGGEAAFDGVLMRDGGHVRHIGLVVAPGRVLHVSQGATSRIENYRGGILRHRVSAFVRYRSSKDE